MPQNEYYVYLYLREDGTPYYVGKGKNNRAFSLKRRISPPPKERIIIHTENLSENGAFELEKKLIAQYGRKDNDTGILRNLTDGGEGSSGRFFSDEQKIQISKAVKEAMNRPGVKAKISKVTKEAMNSPEVRAKLSKAVKEAMNSPERRKIYDSLEWKDKISKTLKNAMNRPEVRAKLSKATKEAMNRPDVKKRHIDALNHPDVKAKRKEMYDSLEMRAKISKATKEAMNRPDVQAKRKEYWARKKAEKLQASANLTEFFISDPASD
jgi:hypothetical protein